MGNAAYIHLSVAFIQMLKAVMWVAQAVGQGPCALQPDFLQPPYEGGGCPNDAGTGRCQLGSLPPLGTVA